MKDQAESLRQLVSGQRVSGTVVIAVTAAKPGSGVTSVAVNIATSLMLHGKRVVLFDYSNSTFELLGGTSPDNEEAFREFLKGNLQLQDMLIQTSVGLRVLIQAEIMVNAGETKRKSIEQLKQELAKLGEADYVIVHLPMGITKESIPYIAGSDRLFLISEPDIEAVRDTYGMIKAITQRVRKDKIPVTHLVINKSLSDDSSRTLAERLINGVQQFLNHHIIYAGAIPLDEAVVSSRKSGRPFVIQSPLSSASGNIEKITSQILKITLKKSDNQIMYSGMRKLIDQIL
ncbi:MAG: P-loop NTPase [Bacteroidetes bacterium]|nr:P-loop NTPase [Bacteroidota bacterium]